MHSASSRRFALLSRSVGFRRAFRGAAALSRVWYRLALLQEVSTNGIRLVLGALERLRVPIHPILAEVPLPEAELRALGGRVDWDVWVELVEAIERHLGGPQAFDAISEAVQGARTHPFQSVAQLISSPSALYQLNSRWGVPNQYRHMRSTCESLPAGRLRVELSIPESYRGSLPVFRSSLGIMRNLPTLIGLPPSEIVSFEVQSHSLSVVLTPPRSRTVFSHARRLRERLGGLSSMLAQLGEQELELDEKNVRLEQQLEEQKRIEAALRASEERWRALAENAPGTLFILSQQGELVSASRAFRGIEASALTGRTFAELLDPNARELVLQAIARVQREHRIIDVRFHVQQASGDTWYACRLGPISASESDARVCAFLTDISEWVRAERELRERQEERQQSQRLEALGRLAGGVAHDFNNLLTVIRGAAELLLSGRPALDAEQRVEVEQIEKASERAATLTRQLLAFSRQQVIAPEPLLLSEVVENARPMLERLMGEDIQLELEVEQPMSYVLLDRSQVDQILMNLAVNGRDAMPRGGTLRIEIARGIDATDAEREPSSGGYVELRVSDTGLGMAAEVRARIFEPFFSTKQRGAGTGLGLAIVKGIAAQSGGDIAVESELGRGTTFRLRFPVCEDPSAHGAVAASSEPRTSVAREPATILVVEDDTAVRVLIAKMLRLQGYRVLETAAAAEALRIADSQNVDLLLTDVVMPEISGPEVARLLVRNHPDIAVLYMSGYAEHEIARRGIVDPDVKLLNKPFSSEALGRAVRDRLEQQVSLRRKSSSA